jgi:hypothetical protein
MNPTPTFDELAAKLRSWVGRDLDNMEEAYAGGMLTEKLSRRLQRYARIVVAVEHAKYSKGMHGDDCECTQCSLAIVTAEKMLEQRIKGEHRQKQVKISVLDSED